MAPLRVTRGIERIFSRPFSETFRISKNEDFNSPYLENENEFFRNSFETVFRASKSRDRGQLVSTFHLTFTFSLIHRMCQKLYPILLFNFKKPRALINYVLFYADSKTPKFYLIPHMMTLVAWKQSCSHFLSNGLR